MASKTKTETVRIEVRNSDQAALVSYGLGLVHQELSSKLADVADDKLDTFVGNIKYLRKNANHLNEKFSLPMNDQ
tara:strand:- start:222 stop:446 length:225 start_codon:yes stop_codon:yes gene_type:complete